MDLNDVINACNGGRTRTYSWRKTPSQATTAGLWFDLSMSPGNPPPKYWFDAPALIAKTISQSQDGGLFHGSNTSPQTQRLRTITTRASAVTALPLTFYVCDYLLYYPVVDDSVLEPQVMDNTVTLPRYTDGKGVMAVAISVAGRTGGQSFYFTYTNSDGVAGRTSATVVQNSASTLGTVVTSAQATAGGLGSGNPFIGLQSGDSGIRSIDSVVMLGGDVGLFTLVLVKPLAQTAIKEITAPYEKDFLIQDGILPDVYDDAYLGMLCLPQGSLAATVLMGDLQVIWD